MGEELLKISNLTKRLGGLTANNDLSLTVTDGELHAVIGPNGAGKTTLISQLFGELRPDSGSICFAGEEIVALSTATRVRRGIGRSFQITQLLLDYSALDNVTIAVQALEGHSFHFWCDARADRPLRLHALRGLARVGLEGRADVIVKEMSYGEQKQLELAIALATQPRLLLLDEPLAGLGATEGSEPIELLRALKGKTTILLVEHDVEAVFALADRISVLVSGRCVATGSGAEIRNNEMVRVAYLGEEEI
jgi:branched-chain amino acid transport system ATP-binding protein